MADETEADPEAHVAVLGTVLKAPTCTTTGIGRYECEVCGANLGYQVITATHKWDAGEVVEEATCGTNGKMVYHCTVEGCDGEKEEVIPATGAHNMEETVIEATCTEPAKVGEKCTVCGQEGETEVVAGSEALGHDLQLDTENEGYVAATCEEGGHDTLKCSRCDYTEEKDTEALGHQYDEGVHTEATCEDASGVLYTCEVCGATKVEEYPPEIGEEALGHDYEAEVTEPTCAAGGYTTYTCTRCGDSYTADETEADPEAHVWNEHVLKEATCTTPGIVRKTCELCGVSTVESILAEHQWSEDMAGNACVYRRCEICGAITIVATFEGYEDCEGQHTPVDVPEIPATNETEGRTAGKVCSVCGVILEGCDTIPVLDHTHEWDEGVVTKEPTATETGIKTFTCTVCSATKTEDIVKVHTHDYTRLGEIVKESSCETEGERWVYCNYEGCNERVLKPVPAIGSHDWDFANAECLKKATCTEQGTMLMHCKRDASHTMTYSYGGTGHVWNEGVITTPPTYDEYGVRTLHCKNCNATTTEKVLPTKYTFTVTVVQPTCTEDGYTMHKCNEDDSFSYKDNIVHSTGHHAAKRVIEPTCKEEGRTEIYCPVCGDVSSIINTTPKTNNHTWDNGVVTTEPTAEKDGVKTYTCTVCNETKTETIPRLNASGK